MVIDAGVYEDLMRDLKNAVANNQVKPAFYKTKEVMRMLNCKSDKLKSILNEDYCLLVKGLDVGTFTAESVEREVLRRSGQKYSAKRVKK